MKSTQTRTRECPQFVLWANLAAPVCRGNPADPFSVMGHVKSGSRLSRLSYQALPIQRQGLHARKNSANERQGIPDIPAS